MREDGYDGQGNAYLFTSYDAARRQRLVNQVHASSTAWASSPPSTSRTHGGAVNTGTTPKVQYAYSEMAGGANHSRLTSMTYPNGRVLNYNYASGLDDSISRLVVALGQPRARWRATTTWAWARWSARPPAAGRRPDLHQAAARPTATPATSTPAWTASAAWWTSAGSRRSDGSHTDRFQYGYDRNGNRLYRENLVNASFSELYHANGASRLRPAQPADRASGAARSPTATATASPTR